MKISPCTYGSQRWITAFLLFLQFSAHTVGAQSTTFFEHGYEVSHYGAEYGFSHDAVYSIIQDREGYLWMINNYKLIRYDGLIFKSFRPKEGEREYDPSDQFQWLSDDLYGNIWIGTLGDCLWKFDRKTEDFEQISSQYYSFRNPSQLAPTLSKEGDLWLLNESGVIRIDPLTNSIDTIFPYKRLELLNSLLDIVPQVDRKPLMADDKQGKSFTVTQPSKYLAIGMGLFHERYDYFIESAAILDGESQSLWQMTPLKSIAVDETKRLCLQILELKAGTYTILSEQLTLQSDPAILKMDSMGRMINSGVFLLPLDDKTATRLARKLADIEKNIAPYLTRQIIMAADRDGLPLILSELHGLFAITAAQDSFFLEKRANPIQRKETDGITIYEYAPKGEESFWVSGAYRNNNSDESYSFLGIWDMISGSFRHLNIDKKIESEIFGLQQDKQGNLWISSRGDGLFIIKNAFDLADDNRMLRLTPINLFPPAFKKGRKYLWDLLIDDNNNLWIGTRMNYLYKIDLDPSPLQQIDFSVLGLEKGNFYCNPVDDGQGHIWFSANNIQEGVLYRYNKTTTTIETFTHDSYKLPNDQLFPLYKDGGGGVVFGGDHDLIRYYGGGFAAEALGFPDNLEIYKVVESLETPKPIFLLINKEGDASGPFYIYDQSSNKLLTKPILSDIICMFRQNEDGRIYIGTFFELLEVDPSTGEHEEVLTDMPNVFCMHEDEQGRFWLGTFVGLAIWNPITDTLIYLDENDGLSNANVVEIEEDDQGFLWLFSFQGVFRADPQTLQIQSFPQLRGIGKLRMAQWEQVFRDEQGYFNAFSEDGFYRFHPDSLSADTTAPRLNLQYSRFTDGAEEVVDQFNVYAHSIAADDTYVFPYFQNNVTIEYVGIQLNDPQGVSYRYRLAGLNESWQEVGAERIARFQDLPPGGYTFVAEATSTYGIKSPPLEFSFTILPPWYWAWWSKLLYILFVGGVIYSFYRFQLSKRLAEQETVRLRELDEVKNRLYTNITHEFRTPLTVIQGMAQQINGKYKKETQLIRKHSENLLHLVNQMLDLSKLESGKLRLQIVQGDIIGFLRHEIDAFRSLAASKAVTLSFESSHPELLMDFDVQKLRQVVSNVLSNAIKFIDGEGQVSVVARHLEDQLEITVADNGIGIPADRLPYIFDRFYQIDDKATRAHEGTGIGLALTRELVELMQGRITVASTLGEGTRFTIQLPVRNRAPLAEFGPEWEVLTVVPPTGSVGFGVGPAFNDPSQATALIIEDNEDIIQYLIYCLQDDYQILTALNGEEGIKAAITHTPDIIISDVMMPKTDGFEVTTTLKEDERTSHIPIILLTAKADQASKVKGLDSGADAYLSKPFDRVELMIRLENLIRLRKTLQTKYSSLDYFAPNKVIINPKEDVFLQKLKEQIEAHLEEADFGIEQLASAMTLSRSQLYRKTKALTGQSIAAFVRTVRLHHGKKLLRATDLSVSEVAYRVGFNDPAYFSKTYAELFGYPPGQERE